MRLNSEGLKPIDGVPAYLVIREEPRKISRDCFISYLGNKYSVPYRFAGREAILQIFHDHVIAAAVLDRILHHCTTINIKGESYRLKERKKHGLTIQRK